MVALLYIISFSGFGGFFLLYFNSILKISFKASKKEVFFSKKEKILYLIALVLFLVLIVVTKQIGKASIVLSGILTLLGIIITTINIKGIRVNEIISKRDTKILVLGIILNIIANLNGMIVRGAIWPFIILIYWILSIVISETKSYTKIVKIYWFFMLFIIGLFKLTNGKKIIGTIGQAVISVGETIGKRYMNKTVITLIVPIIMIIFILGIEYIKKEKGKYGNKNI